MVQHLDFLLVDVVENVMVLCVTDMYTNIHILFRSVDTIKRFCHAWLHQNSKLISVNFVKPCLELD